MKLAVLEVSRTDQQALRPWSNDADCLTLAVLPHGGGTWRREPVPMTSYEAVAERHFRLYEPLFEAGANDAGPRLPGAEIGLMAAADFSLFVETRYQLVLLADLERLVRQYRIDRIEYITDSADGGRYREAVRAFATSRGLSYRRVQVQAKHLGVARTVWRGLNSAAGEVWMHGPAYLGYLRSEMRRRRHAWRSGASPTRRASTPLTAREGAAVRVAMLVYHAKSWSHLLPIRAALVEAGHDVLLVSPRLECDKALDAAGVDYVACHGALPKPKLRRSVAEYLAHFPWHDPDDELNALVAEGGPLRSLVISRALGACDVYTDLAEKLAELLAAHRTNVVLGTDGGSVAGRTLFRTAQRMNIEPVFVQHGSVFALVGVRQYMLQSHRLLWGQTSCDILARCGVDRPERIVCHGSPFHEQRYASIAGGAAEADAQSSAPVLVTFGVPGGYVTEGAFRRAAHAVFRAASRFPGVRFLVKPHPGDPGRVWRQLQADFGVANVELCANRDTYELIRGCKVVLTMFSTTGSEAICMGKPVVSINPDDRLAGEEYLQAGAAYSVRDGDELREVLQSLFQSEPGGDRLAESRRRFAESFLHREDRSAAERTVDFLEGLVQARVAEPAQRS